MRRSYFIASNPLDPFFRKARRDVEKNALPCRFTVARAHAWSGSSTNEKSSKSRFHDSQHQNLALPALLRELLAIFVASFGSDHDQTDRVTEETRPANVVLPAMGPETAAAIASPSADTACSEAPRCSAPVKRIAEEMLQCLLRVEPEMRERLQALVDTFSNSPRMRFNPADRGTVLKRVEEDDEYDWREPQHQLDSKVPDGPCLLDAVN